MKTIDTHSQTINIGGKNHTLVHYLTETKGIFGLGVRLDAEYAEDNDFTESYAFAHQIFETMYKEAVLPLNFYSVLDDMYIPEETAAALEK